MQINQWFKNQNFNHQVCHLKLLKNLIIVVSFLYSLIGFTHGTYYPHDNKKWFLHESNTFIHGDFICSSNGMVTMRLANQSALVKYL